MIRNGTAPQSALAEYAPKTRIAGACAELCPEDNAGQKRMAVVATNLNPQSTAFGRRNDAPGSGWNALCRGLENDPQARTWCPCEALQRARERVSDREPSFARRMRETTE